jgi:hypothetical protein
MKIKTKVLNTFFKKVYMNGGVNNCLLDFSTLGVTVVAMNTTNTAKVRVVLDKDAFTDYEAIGKVALQNLDKLLGVINGMGDSVSLGVEGNLLVLKNGGRKVETELMSTEALTEESWKDMTTTEGLSKIGFSSGWLNSLISDSSVNKEYFLKFKLVDGLLTVTSTGVYKFTESLVDEGFKGDVFVSYGQPLVDIFKALSCDVEVWLKNDFPAIVKEVSDHTVFEGVVAPRITND